MTSDIPIINSHFKPLHFRLQPLIFQYIYHIKLATLRPCMKFQNRPPLQSFNWETFDHFHYRKNMDMGSSAKF